MGAGGSAQREYERRRAKDRDRRRRTWKRSLALVLLTFPAVYGLVRFSTLVVNDWVVPKITESLQDSIEQPTGATPGSAGDQPSDETIPPALANTLGLGLAGFSTLGMAVRVWGPRQSTEAWGQGAAGERATGESLDALPNGFVALHDLKMPGSRANIDHLVIWPTGAFTVETKNYQAGVVIKSRRATRSGRSIDGVIAQAQGQAEVMSRVLDLAVRPVVCVQGGGVEVRGWFQKPTVDGVRFCSGKRLVDVLTKGPRVLSEAQITAAAGLERSTGPTAEEVAASVGTKKADGKGRCRAKEAAAPRPGPATTARVPRSATAPTCSCDAPMILRHRRSDGEAFYGCSTFPRCRQTRPA